MNQASFFIDQKALFGAYPNHNQIVELQEQGVTWFIDLTYNDEKNIKVYSHLVHNWINYPIKDGHVPEDQKKFTIFLLLIQMVLESLKPGEKLYLHCRGGHGRSSLVVSCFLSMRFKMSPFDSLNLTRKYHSVRPNLRSKWLVSWPLNIKQRLFVKTFFSSIQLYSNFSDDKIKGIVTKADFFRYMTVLNYYLHQHGSILELLLNSGSKTIKGEGITSIILQELRFYILYFKAKRLFEFNRI